MKLKDSKKMKKITLPEEIIKALDNGGALVVSVSGGKDSDCLTLELAQMRDDIGETFDIGSL